MSVKTYHVSTASAFPSLPLPASALIFRNGAYQTPGIDYNEQGTAFAFLPGILSDGDGITVVTLP